MKTLSRRIPTALLVLASVATAFQNSLAPSFRQTNKNQVLLREGSSNNDANGSSSSATAVLAAKPDDSAFLPLQSEYGKSMEYPDTYVSCGVCGVAFAMTKELMGSAGRRMECSVCDHTWFQSADRLGKLNEKFEMIPLPERDSQRIQLNIEEGKAPKFTGDSKLYVGNISFRATEEDVVDFFETIGPVGEISFVVDDNGRPRGFAFITMRNKDDGEEALEALNGKELKGRKMNVRASNK